MLGRIESGDAIQGVSVQKTFRIPMLRSLILACGAALVIFLAGLPPTVATPPAAPVVPTVNAELGACSAEFTVKDGQQKPIYGVKIDVTFKYGFLNLHKESLEVYTNSDGKGRFEGLPNYLKKPLVFHVQHGDQQKTVTDDPGVTCNASEPVVLP
jgi:hypothetical protein